MAKPKCSVLVKIYGININVWTNHPEKYIKEISGIEGVSSATVYGGRNPIFLTIDPRYDAQEVADEIKALLTAEVPDVFRD